MHIELHARFANEPTALRARDLTSACVHCGFCLETCPTYLDGRDERDSPRGRIYLIKSLLEEGSAGAETRTHLDRCLTCRSCETTCPSGMQYAQLLDIGRALIEVEAPRATAGRIARRLLRFGFAKPSLLRAGLVAARLVRPLLPAALRRKIPAGQRAGKLPGTAHARRMLVLEGCVQRAATPLTNAAAKRVLDRLGITLVGVAQATCCGALDHHLAAEDAGRERIRRNIDAWWPHVEAGAEAIVASASGCGAHIAQYGELMAADPGYADKAATISSMHRDLARVLAAEDLEALSPRTDVGRIAVHTPCTLQHGLGEQGLLRDILSRAGFSLAATQDEHLCCGSAGSYSILQPRISGRLRERALANLASDAPDLIVTANIGCQLHLQSPDIPVKHWIELFDAV